ncbi:hypothetical protein KQH82_04910 [bacterium]|nr:hypothetical protein [bacterium]
MRKSLLLATILGLVVLMGAPTAMAGDGKGSAWAHAFNWFQDADGDGIPNGLDPDWIRPYDGDGYKHGHRFQIGEQSSTDGGPTGDQDQDRLRDRLQDCFQTDGDQIRLRLRDNSCLD